MRRKTAAWMIEQAGGLRVVGLWATGQKGIPFVRDRTYLRTGGVSLAVPDPATPYRAVRGCG
jgi:hypothetical protein